MRNKYSYNSDVPTLDFKIKSVFDLSLNTTVDLNKIILIQYPVLAAIQQFIGQLFTNLSRFHSYKLKPTANIKRIESLYYFKNKLIHHNELMTFSVITPKIFVSSYIVYFLIISKFCYDSWFLYEKLKFNRLGIVEVKGTKYLSK